ncbi:unnamed protein product, partial [Rhizoctonia solani]
KTVSLKSSSQPSPAKQIDLNSFVYQKRIIERSASYSNSSRPKSGSKNKDQVVSLVASSSDVSKASVGSTKPSHSLKKFTLGITKECPNAEATFTAEQINSLCRCVVCGHPWTARKLPKHKWHHIISCARKCGCELDVLYVKLIAAVVDAPEPKNKKSVKDKEPQREPSGPRSLLAHTVQKHAPAKKRGRRAEPESPVLQPVEDIRKIILERGAALLGVAPILDAESQQDVIPGISTESQLSKEKQEEEQGIPSTQTFAPSKIGERPRLFGDALATLNMDTRSGLFYADTPCTISPNITTGTLSTFQIRNNPPVIHPFYLHV